MFMDEPCPDYKLRDPNLSSGTLIGILRAILLRKSRTVKTLPIQKPILIISIQSICNNFQSTELILTEGDFIQ